MPRRLRVLAMSGACLALSCGSPGGATYAPQGRVSEAATVSFDFDPPAGLTHGVRVFLSAETFDGSCVLSDETGEEPIQGLDMASLSVSCPGANALGATSLAEQVQPDGVVNSVWTLHGHADAVSGADASANLYVADSYVATLLPTPTPSPGVSPSPTPEAARLFLHVDISGALEGGGSGFGEYETDARFWTVLPDGTFQLLAPSPGSRSPFSFFVSQFGNHHNVYDVDLPPVPFGTTLLMDSGFLFNLAIANSGIEFLSDATAEVSLCSHDANVVLASASGSTGKCPGTSGDLRLVSVEPVQTTFGADLVADKDMVVEADLSSTFDEPVSAVVSLTFDQPDLAHPVTYTENVTIPAHCQNKRYFFPNPRDQDSCGVSEATGGFGALGLAPRLEHALSSFLLSAHVALTTGKPDDVPTDDDIAMPASKRVIRTALSVGYSQMETESDRIEENDYAEAVLWSDRFNLGMLPISPTGFESSRCVESSGDNCEDFASTIPCTFDELGMPESCDGLDADHRQSYQTVKMFVPRAKRAVAFVPDGFFSLVGLPGYVGDTAHSSVLVEVGWPSGARSGVHTPTVPHELIHTFGFHHTPPEVPLGYWVDCTIFGVATCLVPSSAANFFSTAQHFPDETLPGSWITGEVYEALVRQADVRMNADPPSLMITGTWFDDGTLRVDTLDEFAAATNDVAPDVRSDYAIELVDDSGQVIASNPYDPQFDRVFDGYGVDPITARLKSAPILATIAYPEMTARVRFTMNGSVMLELDPLSGTLRRMIESIPESGYKKNPKDRRKALIEKVGAFETMIAKRDLRGADMKLEHDIRTSVNDWIVDYPAEISMKQYSKPKLLEGIDLISARLKARIGALK